MFMRFRTLAAGLLMLCAALSIAPAHASVIVSGTRVIFSAQDGEVTVRLSNDNATPALIEAWVDDGDEKSTPDKVNTPFVITPPLFRMEPHKDQSLRIIATGNQLPPDRESLFWLNVLEIPPKPTSPEMTGKNVLQFAFRSRLKMFYRPANLQGDPIKAPAQLTWKMVHEGADYAIEAKNPTPYHITIVKLSVEANGKSYSHDDTAMVEPKGTARLSIAGLSQVLGPNAKVSYDIVNDYGATMSLTGNVSP